MERYKHILMEFSGNVTGQGPSTIDDLIMTILSNLLHIHIYSILYYRVSCLRAFTSSCYISTALEISVIVLPQFIHKKPTAHIS